MSRDCSWIVKKNKKMLRTTCHMSRHSRVLFLVIKKFGCNGPCIIAINKMSRLQLKIWWNIRLDFFLIDDVAKIYFVNAFVGILKFIEQTCLLFFFTWLLKKPMVSKIRNHRTESGVNESKLAYFLYFFKHIEHLTFTVLFQS